MMLSIGADHNPNFGILSIPIMGVGYCHTFGMTIRDVLAVNFARLRAACPKLNKLPDITKAGGGANGTLGRIATRETGLSIDGLEQLASAYGVEPWQLLVPTLEAHQGERGKLILGGLPDWPFPLIDRARYERLTPEQRGFVQTRLDDALAYVESQSMKTTKPAANGSAPAKKTRPAA
jgi:hypothetical protein